MPNYLHFIWFGSCLSAKYQNNLVSYKSLNPAYRLILWTDYQTLSQEDCADMNLFCTKHGIELRDIRHQELTNQDLIEFELDRSAADRKEMARIHYVRASDLARVAVLVKHGGIYNDTDSECREAIPEKITLPHGFLSQKTYINELNFETNRNALIEQIYYHFMMAEPDNAVLQLAAEISRLDYTTYNASKNKLWETHDNRQAHLEGTVKLTGTSIKWALNYLCQKKKIILQNMDELFLEAGQFSVTTFDKSWLQDFQSDLKSDEHDECNESLDTFCWEIERNRQQHYPLLTQRSNTRLFSVTTNPEVLSPDWAIFKQNFEIPSINMDEAFAPGRHSLHFTFEIPSIQMNFKHFDILPIVESYHLKNLKNNLQQVHKKYVNYSLTHCRYSLFHSHGVAGRKRVNEWMSRIESISDISSLQNEILAYLQNSANGNTYPHSFRMMLVTSLCDNTNLCSLQFDELLLQLETKWSSSAIHSPENQSTGYSN